MTATIADYEEVLADHRRLVRRLDVALNGEEGAAKQASLCDIVAQVEGAELVKDETCELRLRLLGSQGREAALRKAMERAIKIIDTNLNHQREKVWDASSILKDALASKA